jgi:hypothetical protein
VGFHAIEGILGEDDGKLEMAANIKEKISTVQVATLWL